MTDDAGRQCQGTPVAPSEGRPWSGTPRAEDHDALERVLRETPEGAPIICLARRLFGEDVESSDKDWQFVKRHCDRYHRVFQPTGKVVKRTDSGEYENQETTADILWVKPTATPAEGVLEQQVAERPVAGESDGRSWALANAEVCLSARSELKTAEAWGDLVGAFGGKRAGEESGGAPERTRFNDVERALRGRDRVETAFTGALSAGLDRGVMVTATTWWKLFDSIADAAADVVADAGLLRRWVGRPPGVTVIEPTARGVPHPHIALFVERDALPSEHDLHDYWRERRERGFEVDPEPLIADGGTWTWDGDAPADADGRPPVAYLSEGANALATVAADADAEDVLAVAAAYRERGDMAIAADPDPEDEAVAIDAVDAAVAAETGVDAGAVRRAAWYFGTGLKTATRPSPALSTAVESDGEKR